jgi:hypothetical protein
MPEKQICRELSPQEPRLLQERGQGHKTLELMRERGFIDVTNVSGGLRTGHRRDSLEKDPDGASGIDFPIYDRFFTSGLLSDYCSLSQ